MKTKQIRFFDYFLTTAIISILTMVMVSCSSTATSKSTTTTTPKTVLSSISITSDSTANLPVSFTKQFTAMGTYLDGSTTDISYRVTWASSDTSIATISLTGLATGKAVGNTDITATMSGVNSPVVNLTIVPTPMLASIAVTPTTPDNLEIGSTQQFTAIGSYVNGSTQDITSLVTWMSSDTNIASIYSAGSDTSSAGLATSKAVGNTNIKATLSGITSPVIKLTVKDIMLSSIAVTPINPSNLSVGFTAQFTAIGLYSDDSTANITSQVIWSSSDTNVATINKDGLATGKGAGNTNITATLSGINSPAIILPVSTLSSITISPALPDNLIVGSTQLFKVIGTYSNGVNSLITAEAIWTSSNTNIATITKDGLATGKAAGSTNISVSFSGLTSPSINLTVVSPASTTSTTPTMTP